MVCVLNQAVTALRFLAACAENIISEYGEIAKPETSFRGPSPPVLAYQAPLWNSQALSSGGKRSKAGLLKQTSEG